MIEVEAKQIGFYGNRRRYPKGHAKYETFSVDKVDGSWMRVIGNKEKPILSELNQGGEQSPPAPQENNLQESVDKNDTLIEEQEPTALSRKKRDDLIAIAVERRLNENIDLTQLNRVQLISLIQESYLAEQKPELEENK